MRKGIKKEQVTLKLRFPRQQHLMPALCSCSQVLLLTRGCYLPGAVIAAATPQPQGDRHAAAGLPPPESSLLAWGPPSNGRAGSEAWHGQVQGTSDFLSELPCKKEPRFLSLKSPFSRDNDQADVVLRCQAAAVKGGPELPRVNWSVPAQVLAQHQNVEKLFLSKTS